jgi:RNA-splicing ligase RtcB
LDGLFTELIQRLSSTRPSAVLSQEDLADVMLRGAQAAVERYDLDPSTPEYMDQQGNALPAGVDSQAVLRAVPRVLLEMGGREFAQVGRGNHFLELQVVEEIRDDGVARLWGVESGQLVVMYHADSGHLGAMVGRLYAHRRKNTWRGRLFEWQVKLPFQYRAGRIGRILHRINYHIVPRRLSSVPVNAEEGQRTLLALQAASNYAYANRLAVLAVLRDAIRGVWGAGCDPPSLLWDAPHNSIRRETVAGQELWVHRHNAVRVGPPSQTHARSPFGRTGQPALLPGTDLTSSYLCVADEGAAQTLFSADHGAGRSALRLGRSLNGGSVTRRYTYGNGVAETCSHLSDDGVNAVLQGLQACGIVRPVARLRPLAVLKG